MAPFRSAPQPERAKSTSDRYQQHQQDTPPAQLRECYVRLGIGAPHGLKKPAREQESQEREESHQGAEYKESGKKSEADGTAHGPKRDPAV